MSTARKTGLMVLGAVAARAALAGLQAKQPGGKQLWERTNHRGTSVSLLAGPVLAGVAAVTAACGAPNRKVASAALLAGVGAGAAGLYDDVVGSRPEQKAYKGFRGHVRALREGQVSAGMVKLVGVSAVSMVAARAVARSPLDTVVTAGVIAGTANIMNLLDLRPGRALKAGLLLGGPLLGGVNGEVVAGSLGAAMGLLPDDLGENVMLGDTGANALGAILGLRLAHVGGPGWRLGALVVLAGLTAASEKVSFTKVIASTPGLRHIDELGRRPVAA